MTEFQNPKNYYDLEERTHNFSRDVRGFCKSIKSTVYNTDDIRQVIRSSGSVAANYIEANEALSRKDFIMRIKICRKEAKESIHWLDLLETDGELRKENNRLIDESSQLMKIFGKILEKSVD